jgi:hypothetical protein
MSCTQAELLSLIRERLSDVDVWTDANVLQWIVDAVADYSTVFPQTGLEATIECVASQRAYTLAESLVNPHGITLVEYPAGEDPPVYLSRRGVKDPRGFYGGPYYDVLGSPPVTLVIGEEPSEGEDIVVTYDGDHDYPVEDDDVLTVRDSHLEALVLFVLWKAAEHVLAGEEADPDTASLLMTQYGAVAAQAERAYRDLMARVQEQRAESAIVSWSELGLE